MKWHTHSAGQKAGPFSIEELRAKMASGQLTGEIFVWREGFPAWKKLTEVPELSSLLAPAPPVAEAPPDFPSLEATDIRISSWGKRSGSSFEGRA
jgi:hypothetical protein